jgi:ketosteroid isomerase-like protein
MTIPESLASAMRSVNLIFESSVIKARDFKAVDRVYTANARILPPGADLIEGRGAIARFWEQAVTGLNVLGASLTTVDARLTGECIIEVGRAVLQLAGGQSVALKYVVEWRREDDAWKWHTDIWNTNS